MLRCFEAFRSCNRTWYLCRFAFDDFCKDLLMAVRDRLQLKTRASANTGVIKGGHKLSYSDLGVRSMYNHLRSQSESRVV